MWVRRSFLHSRRIGFAHYETSLELSGEPPCGHDSVEQLLCRYTELTASAYAQAPQFSQVLLNNLRRWVLCLRRLIATAESTPF